MLQPNYTEKSLVPYAPKKSRHNVFEFLNSAFASAKGTVFLFLCLFFVVSAFARCVCLYCPETAIDLQADIDAVHGFSLSESWKLFAPVAVMMLLSFTAGFSSLSAPAAFVSAAVYFYRFSFVCFALLYDCDRLHFVFEMSAVSLSGIFYHAVITYFEARNTLPQRVIYTFLCCVFAALTVLFAYILLK